MSCKALVMNKTFSIVNLTTVCLYTVNQKYLIALIILQLHESGAEYRRVCYFTNWSQYDTPQFLPANIDPTLCSHVLFAFANISGNQLTTTDWNDETLLVLHGKTIPNLSELSYFNV